MLARKSKKRKLRSTLESLFTEYPVEFSTAIITQEEMSTISFPTLSEPEFTKIARDLETLAFNSCYRYSKKKSIQPVHFKSKYLGTLYEEIPPLSKKYRSTIDDVLQEHPLDVNNVISDYVVGPYGYDKKNQQEQKSSLASAPQTLFATKSTTDLTLSKQLGLDKTIDADMKSINIDFINSSDLHRQKQGAALIEIYQDLEKVLEQVNRSTYIYEISLDFLAALKIKIANVTNTMNIEDESAFTKIWYNKLLILNEYITRIQINIIQSKPSEEEKSGMMKVQ